MYRVIFSRQALKDRDKILSAGLGAKVKKLAQVLAENPFMNPPPYEKLSGDLKGYYSRRINRQHRLVYEVIESEKAVHVLTLWTHYENI